MGYKCSFYLLQMAVLQEKDTDLHNPCKQPDTEVHSSVNGAALFLSDVCLPPYCCPSSGLSFEIVILCLQADLLWGSSLWQLPTSSAKYFLCFVLSELLSVLIPRHYPKAVPPLILAGLCTSEFGSRCCLSQYTAECGLSRSDIMFEEGKQWLENAMWWMLLCF